MKLTSKDQRWHVTANGQVLHDSLEELAFQQGYRVAAVSHELGITEQHLRRMFHRDVGIQVKEWMQQERMLAARQMLQTEKRLATVSDALGFAHPNSFRREFAKVHGTTPRRLQQDLVQLLGKQRNPMD